MELSKITDNLIGDKHIRIIGQDIVILTLLPYMPYDYSKINAELEISSYYYFSNMLYHNIKDVCHSLKDNGYDASYKSTYPLKSLALSFKLGKILKSQLFCSHTYGTYVVLGAIHIKLNSVDDEQIKNIGVIEPPAIIDLNQINADGSYNHNKNKPNKKDILDNTDNMAILDAQENNQENAFNNQDKCKDCNLCIIACPNNAIGHNSFYKHKCVRYVQDNIDVADKDSLKALNNKLLGCDVCQLVCPYNSNIEKMDVFSLLKPYLNIKTMENACNIGKAALTPLVDFIGWNYIKPNKLLKLIDIIKLNYQDNIQDN